jgi:hypothetical protein
MGQNDRIERSRALATPARTRRSGAADPSGWQRAAVPIATLARCRDPHHSQAITRRSRLFSSCIGRRLW